MTGMELSGNRWTQFSRIQMPMDHQYRKPVIATLSLCVCVTFPSKRDDMTGMELSGNTG